MKDQFDSELFLNDLVLVHLRGKQGYTICKIESISDKIESIGLYLLIEKTTIGTHTRNVVKLPQELLKTMLIKQELSK
jgi:hypothetical protein